MRKDGKTSNSLFDILIVATGLFCLPFTPKVEGMDSFQGEIYHSGEVLDADLVKNKRALIVGVLFLPCAW